MAESRNNDFTSLEDNSNEKKSKVVENSSFGYLEEKAENKSSDILIKERIETPKSIDLEPVKVINYDTGDNPYSKYYGPGIFYFEDKYSVFISSNEKDILFNITNDEKNILVRSVYLKANTKHIIKYLEPGTYYLSYISGKRWSEIKINNCIDGGFIDDLTYYRNNKPIVIDNQNLLNVVRIDSDDFRISQDLNNFPFTCSSSSPTNPNSF